MQLLKVFSVLALGVAAVGAVPVADADANAAPNAAPEAVADAVPAAAPDLAARQEDRCPVRMPPCQNGNNVGGHGCGPRGACLQAPCHRRNCQGPAFQVSACPSESACARDLAGTAHARGSWVGDSQWLGLC